MQRLWRHFTPCAGTITIPHSSHTSTNTNVILRTTALCQYNLPHRTIRTVPRRVRILAPHSRQLCSLNMLPSATGSLVLKQHTRVQSHAPRRRGQCILTFFEIFCAGQKGSPSSLTTSADDSEVVGPKGVNSHSFSLRSVSLLASKCASDPSHHTRTPKPYPPFLYLCYRCFQLLAQVWKSSCGSDIPAKLYHRGDRREKSKQR